MYGRRVFTVDHQQYVIDPANHLQAETGDMGDPDKAISLVSFWTDATRTSIKSPMRTVVFFSSLRLEKCNFMTKREEANRTILDLPGEEMFS
jgi:hypothetical protein